MLSRRICATSSFRTFGMCEKIARSFPSQLLEPGNATSIRRCSTRSYPSRVGSGSFQDCRVPKPRAYTTLADPIAANTSDKRCDITLFRDERHTKQGQHNCLRTLTWHTRLPSRRDPQVQLFHQPRLLTAFVHQLDEL